MEELPIELVKGANVELGRLKAQLGKLNVVVSSPVPVSDDGEGPDVSVFLVDERGHVLSNDAFVFYNQPAAFGGAVRLRDRLRDPKTERVVDTITLSLDDLPDDVARVVVVASLEDASEVGFDAKRPITVEIQDAEDAGTLILVELAELGGERAVLAGEFYRRADRWKFRAVGQGYVSGLGAVASTFGVEVEDADSDAVGTEPDGSIEPPAVDGGGDGDGVVEEADAALAGPPELSAPKVSVRRATRPPRLPRDWNKSLPADENDYQRARLFPVAGIGGREEQERRATSAFLAVLPLVRPFARFILHPLGAPAGAVATYTEVPFAHKEDAYRPDGLVEVKRGQREWRALVEVKTGSAELSAEQVTNYVEIARERGFDAVLTISNQLAVADDGSPVDVDRRKLRKVSLYHLSWGQIRTEAALATAEQFADSTQHAILAEFIRYMDHERSGMNGFTDMGKRWTRARDSSKTQTLRLSDAATTEVVDRFDQLMQHTALQLTSLLGTRVSSVAPANAPDQLSRAEQLVDAGTLFGSIVVPGAAGRMIVTANIRTDVVSVSMSVKASRSGRLETRIKHLVRQIPDAIDSARVESVSFGPRAETRPALLGVVRADPKILLHSDGRDPREFTVTYSARMGQKRASGAGTFITSVVNLVHTFYADVGQNLS